MVEWCRVELDQREKEEIKRVDKRIKLTAKTWCTIPFNQINSKKKERKINLDCCNFNTLTTTNLVL